MFLSPQDKKIPISCVEYALDSWCSGFLTLNPDNSFRSIELENDEEVRPMSPCILRCMDTDGKTPFWIIIQDTRAYHAMYNRATKKVEKMRPYPLEVGSKYLACSLFTVDEQAYNESLRRFERFNELKGLLSAVGGLIDDLVRAPDASVVYGREDYVAERTEAFRKRCLEGYIALVKGELREIMETHATNPVVCKDALITYLREHAERIQGTSVFYTALPEHIVTKLLVSLAIRLAAFDGVSPMQYLLPKVCTEALSDDYPKISPKDAAEFMTLLHQHIIDEEGEYLYPVALLLAYTRLLTEGRNPLVTAQHQLFNPYFDERKMNSRLIISQDAFQRLCSHSHETEALMEAYARYSEASTNKSTLLGQLNRLMGILRGSDAHGGIGRSTDVYQLAYPAISAFMDYYHQINPVGFYQTSETPGPKLLPTECNLGYLLVKDGENSGLYFANRYTNKVTRICDALKRARYPLCLLAVDALNESFVGELPTLIRVMSDPAGQYYMYGRKRDGRIEMTILQTDAKFRLPVDSHGSVKLNTATTLPLGNVPDVLYAAIDAHAAHVSEESVVSQLRGMMTPSDVCDLEQLKMIQAHTGHQVLREQTNVPEGVRHEVAELWSYIQDPGKNLSATENLATCVGTIRERLDEAMRSEVSILGAIQWSDENRARHYEDSVVALKDARVALQDALSLGNYAGEDKLSPSPFLLKLLKLPPLRIESEDALCWLCHFEEKAIEAFILDAENPQIREYVRGNYSNFASLSALLLTLPARAYRIILQESGVRMVMGQLKRLLDFLHDEGQKDALIYAVKDDLKTMIRSGEQLGELLLLLDEEKRNLVLEAVKGDLKTIVYNGACLGALLELLDETKQNFVFDAVKDDLKTIIKNVLDLKYLLPFLDPQKRRIVLDAVKGDLKTVIDETHANLMDLLYILSDDECCLVLDTVKDDLKTLINNFWDLKELLLFLDLKKHRMVLDVLKGVSNRIISENNTCLMPLLEMLDDEARNVVLDAVKDDLQTIIKNGVELVALFNIWRSKEREVVFNAVKGGLQTIITNVDDLSELLLILDSPKRRIVLDAVKGGLQTMITNVGDLNELIYMLTDGECRVVFDALKDDWEKIIKSSEDWELLLESLDATRREMVLGAQSNVLNEKRKFSVAFFDVSSPPSDDNSDRAESKKKPKRPGL